MKIFAVAVFGINRCDGYTHYLEVVWEREPTAASVVVEARFREKYPDCRVVSTVTTEVDTTSL